MYIRLLKLWDEAKSSYWFVPGLMVVGAILLSLATVSLDGYFRDKVLRSLGFLWSGGLKLRSTWLSSVRSPVQLLLPGS